VLVAVGDVHGQLALLEDLLSQIDSAGLLDAARLVFLGDYIDRGPDSRGVIERLLELRRQRPDTVFLRGNHEQMLLDALDAGTGSSSAAPRVVPLALWLQGGGDATVRSYGIEPAAPNRAALAACRDVLPADHLAFLRSLTMEYVAERHHFVHAGLPPPGRPVVLPDGRDPRLWIRYDFLQSDSDFGGRTVVYGHTPYRDGQPVIEATRIGIDTAAAYGGPLTAVALAPEVSGRASVMAVLQAFPRAARSRLPAQASPHEAGR